VKERWNRLDRGPGKQLHLGERKTTLEQRAAA
jgi:hypothetical protein